MKTSMKMLGSLLILGTTTLFAQNTFPSTGNVGIGTTSPQRTLDVSATGQITFGDSVISDSTAGIYWWAGTPNGSPDTSNAIYGIFRTPGGWTSPYAQLELEFPTGIIIDGGRSYGKSGLVLQPYGGNVGIGATTPGAKLEVNGNVLLTAGSGASMTYPDGTVQSTAWNGVLSGGDYAESVNVSGGRDEYEPGDVLVIDPASEGRFLKSSAPYSTAVTGIYSTRPGVVGRRQRTARAHMDEEVPMAMTGIVPTKVTAENGSIQPGDLLVSSSTLGYAMKGTDRSRMLGAVIGKALGHLDSGTGVVEVVVTLQ